MNFKFLRSLVGAMLFTFCLGAAFGQTTLRVGKAAAVSFNFTPLDVGDDQGIFKKRGLAIQKFDFAGSARLQQALAAGAIDIALGSGPEFAMAAKGAPAVAVGQIVDKPALHGIIVPMNSPLKKPADLKGKKIAVTTSGSLTMWLVRDLSSHQGWGATGIETPTLGTDPTMIAAMRTGQVDGMVTDMANGYRLEGENVARFIVKFGEVVPHFVTNVIWARKDVVEKNPQAIKDFLAGWYETIAFMRANKEPTVNKVAAVIGSSVPVAGRVYDELVTTLSTNGRFDPVDLKVLASSFPVLNLYDREIDLMPFADLRFLPPQSQ